MGVLEILVQASVLQVSSVEVPTANGFYLAWGCFGVLATLFGVSIAFLTNLIPLDKNSKEKFEAARLILKENTATVFMDTITSEAELLVGVIAEHLPISITQSYKSNPHTSEFDKFCLRIMDINEEEPEKIREAISDSMAEEFSGYITKEAKKLSKILQMHSRLGDTDYNTTRINYALRGDTAKRFNFIAHHLSEAEKTEKEYLSSQKLYRRCFILSIISFASFLLPLFLNKSFCHSLGIFSTATLVLSFVIGFLLWLNSYTIIEKTNDLIKKDFQSAYDEWEKKQ